MRRWFIISFLIWNFDLVVLLFFGQDKLNQWHKLIFNANNFHWIGIFFVYFYYGILCFFGKAITNYVVIPFTSACFWTFGWKIIADKTKDWIQKQNIKVLRRNNCFPLKKFDRKEIV